MNQKVKRKISQEPKFTCFKPDWITKSFIRKNWLFNELQIDEFEALRLAHLEWKSMIKWAKEMKISAATFNRILKSAQEKITDSIVNWKAIRVFKSDWSHNCNY